jgi:RHS repeat-associated protein
MGSYLLEGPSGYAAQNHQVAYTYDGSNRLLSATAKTLGGTPTTLWSQSYMYDRWGNMTCNGSGICAAMTYNTSTNRLATIGNQPVTYDPAGNLKQDGNLGGTYRQYSYDAEGHVTKQIDILGHVENDTYNALGQVVESVTPSYQLEDFYDAFGMGIAAWCIPGNLWCGPQIHLGAGGMILGWDAFAPGPSAQTEFLHKDALGSTRLGTNYAGAPLGDQSFYPWGDLWSVQGVAQDPAGFAGFLGALDTDAVLYGTLNREYAHTMGRWLTPDPLLNSGRPSNPQTWNRYTYALSNPLSITDPTGLYNLVNHCSSGDKRCEKKFNKAALELKNSIDRLNNAVGNMKNGVEKTRLQSSLKALGTENDDNNVFVSFGATKGGGAGETDPTYNPTTQETNFNVTLDPGKIGGGNDIAIDIAHEGTHVSDIEIQLANPGGQPALGPFSLEYRGYQASAWGAQALGNDNLSFRGVQIWNSSWAAVDRATLQDQGITNVVVDKAHPETTPHNPWPN